MTNKISQTFKSIKEVFFHKDHPTSNDLLCEENINLLRIKGVSSNMVKLDVHKIPESRSFTLHCKAKNIIVKINFNVHASRTIEQLEEYFKQTERFYSILPVEGDINQLKKNDILELVEDDISKQPYFKLIPSTSIGEVVINGCELHQEILDDLVEHFDEIGLQIIADFKTKYNGTRVIKGYRDRIVFHTKVLEDNSIKIHVFYSGSHIPHTRHIKDNKLIDDPFTEIKYNKHVIDKPNINSNGIPRPIPKNKDN